MERGVAWYGRARLGKARRGTVFFRRQLTWNVVWCGAVWLVAVGRGEAWNVERLGGVWRGRARPGKEQVGVR